MGTYGYEEFVRLCAHPEVVEADLGPRVRGAESIGHVRVFRRVKSKPLSAKARNKERSCAATRGEGSRRQQGLE